MSSHPVRDAYSAAAKGWAKGPVQMYLRLAERLVSASPLPLSGMLVLDVGAGTGVVSAAVRAAGGRAVALDLSAAMLRQVPKEAAAQSVAADARLLPFRDGAFDAMVAAFALSHVPDPIRMIEEARRAVRRGGVVLTSSFRLGWDHPAKASIDRVLAAAGYVRPDWYTYIKETTEPAVASPRALEQLAEAAGLTQIHVTQHTVETGVRTAESLVDWRLGMAQYASFLASLPPETHYRLPEEATAAVGPHPEPLVPEMLVLSDRVP